MKNILLFLTLCFVVSGCSTVKSFERRTEERREIAVNTPPMSAMPALADLQIDQTRSSTSVRYSEPYNIEAMMVEALSRLQWQQGADIIIEPRYSVLEKNGIATVKASGYAANYKNLRMLSSNDVQLLKKFKTAKKLPERIETYSKTDVELQIHKPENPAAKPGFVFVLGTVSCEDSDDVECKPNSRSSELEGTVSAGLSYRHYFNTNFGFSIDGEYALLGYEEENRELDVHHAGLYVVARASYTIKKWSLGAGLGFGYSAYFKSLLVETPSETFDYSSYQAALGRKLTLTAYYPVSDDLSLGVEWSSLTQNESKEEWKGDIRTKPEDIESEPIGVSKISLGVKVHF